MKKIFITLFVSILFILNGFSQVSITVATVSGTAGQTANVPVTISGIDGTGTGTPVIGIQVNVTYVTNVVSFLEIVNKNATLTAAGTWTTSTANGGTVVALWDATSISTPVSLPDGSTLFDMKFIENNGGTSALSLINVEVLDVNGNPLSTTLTNGSIVFGAPAATTTWNGTGIWYTPANWSNGLPGLSTHAIIASGVVTIDAATGYTNNLTINPGAGVTLDAAKILTINGNLVLESNATQTATGSFLINGNYTVAGTTTVKRFITGGTQHFISIPVTAATIQNIYNPSNPGFLFNFIEASGAWNNPWLLTFQLLVATGYSVNYTGDQTISISNSLNNDSQYAPTLTRNGGGWNLLGNPYACPIDWSIAAGWTKTNLDNATYIWNNNAYASYVGGVGVNGGSKYIPQFQGFFVHASTAGPAIAIKKAARNQGGNDTLFMKDAVANVFRMSISNGTLGDETAVYMTPGATQDFDGEYDAYKLFGFNEDAPHLYTRNADVDYAINGQPLVESVSLPLIVRTSQDGSFNFTASGFETFDSYYFFLLEDKETGITYDLRQNSNLSLNLIQGETSDRFVLRIFKSSLGIGDNLLSSARIYSESNIVYIENCPASQVYVYNMVGSVVASQQFEEASLNRLPLNVPAGIYVVKMTAGNGTVSSKVFIK
jgi:hypothetical protein